MAHELTLEGILCLPLSFSWCQLNDTVDVHVLVWICLNDHSCCREQDKKVCCLGLTSLLALPADQLPGEALGRVFRATLDLLVAYKDQVAGLSLTHTLFFIYISKLGPNPHIYYAPLDTEAAKEEEVEEDDDMDGYPSDEDDDDGDGSDKEMGFDAEDGDEVDSIKLQKLAAQVRTCTHIWLSVIYQNFISISLISYRRTQT